MKHIALDIATNMGFCTPDCSGSINLKKGIYNNRIYNAYWFVNDLIWSYSPDIIAVERIAGAHKQALIVMAKLRGAIELLADEHGIEVVEFSPSEIKKYYTGKGNCNKYAMMEEFSKRTNSIAINDNEADAHAIYELFKSRNQ